MNCSDISNDVWSVICKNATWSTISQFPQREQILKNLTNGERRMLRVEHEYDNKYTPDSTTSKWFKFDNTYVRLTNCDQPHQISIIEYLVMEFYPLQLTHQYGVYHSDEDTPSIEFDQTLIRYTIYCKMGIVHRDSDYQQWESQSRWPQEHDPAYTYCCKKYRMNAWFTDGVCMYANQTLDGTVYQPMPLTEVTQMIFNHNTAPEDIIPYQTEIVTDGYYGKYVNRFATQIITPEGVVMNYRQGIRI